MLNSLAGSVINIEYLCEKIFINLGIAVIAAVTMRWKIAVAVDRILMVMAGKITCAITASVR